MMGRLEPAVDLCGAHASAVSSSDLPPSHRPAAGLQRGSPCAEPRRPPACARDSGRACRALASPTPAVRAPRTTTEHQNPGRHMSATPLTAVPSRRPGPAFRGRIGCDARSGHYAVPRRYRLHLSLSCPDCLRIAVTHSLLGLDETLPGDPAARRARRPGRRALRAAPAVRGERAPLPRSGRGAGAQRRLVRTDRQHPHPRHPARPGPALRRPAAPTLYPSGAEAEIEAVARLCEQGIDAAAQRAGQCRRRRPGDARDALGSLLRTLGSLDAAARRPGRTSWATNSPPPTCELWVDPGAARHRAPLAPGRRRRAPRRRPSAPVGLRPPPGRPPRLRPPPRPRRHRPPAPRALSGPGGGRCGRADPGLGLPRPGPGRIGRRTGVPCAGLTLTAARRA